LYWSGLEWPCGELAHQRWIDIPADCNFVQKAEIWSNDSPVLSTQQTAKLPWASKSIGHVLIPRIPVAVRDKILRLPQPFFLSWSAHRQMLFDGQFISIYGAFTVGAMCELPSTGFYSVWGQLLGVQGPLNSTLE